MVDSGDTAVKLVETWLEQHVFAGIDLPLRSLTALNVSYVDLILLHGASHRGEGKCDAAACEKDRGQWKAYQEMYVVQRPRSAVDKQRERYASLSLRTESTRGVQEARRRSEPSLRRTEMIRGPRRRRSEPSSRCM